MELWETMGNFWKGVLLCIKVFEPLVRVLRLVDGDIKPSMTWLYGELANAKKEIKEAFNNLERNYKDNMAIVEKKMNGRLDSPLHMAAYVLNPHYSYADSSIFTTANEGFQECAEQYFANDPDTCMLVVNDEFLKYENKDGPFGKRLAKACENKSYNPVGWWRLYGGETPNLKEMAMRILSLTSSSSGCERNWSAFESIHTKRRNRLTTERCNNLVFIRFNNRMLSRKQKLLEKKKWDVLISTDATEAQGFLFEGGDDHANVVYLVEEDGDVHPGTGISWDILGEAMGAQEQLQLRRSARVRDLEEEFESDDDDEIVDDEDIEYEDD